MLIDAYTRTIEGPFDLALMVVYAEVVRALRDAGHDETAADQLALRVIPRVEDRLLQAGMVSRQIHDDTDGALP